MKRNRKKQYFKNRGRNDIGKGEGGIEREEERRKTNKQNWRFCKK